MLRERSFLALLAVAVLLLVPGRAHAQAIGDQTKARPVQGDPGIASGVVINDDTTRALRNYAQPGATRSMHKHDDVTSHVFVLLSGQVRMTIEGEAPFDVKAGDVIPVKPGANHTFTNTGQVIATFVEIFNKKTQ
jgi:mannose-6-phosphate isomerase-like protein (cupin superfamily)